MYDTRPVSLAYGAVYRLLIISIAFISCEYKAKMQSCFVAELKRGIKLMGNLCDFPILVQVEKLFNV